jgi:O-antigen ligase
VAVALEIGEARPGGIGWAYVRARAAALLNVFVAIWVFSGGFVLTDPAPYEPLFLVVIAVGAVGGWHLHRRNIPLLVIFFGFVPFALIAAFQVKFTEVSDAFIFVGVTIFLFFTACFSADYVADDPVPRMRLVIRWYTAGAVICALAGILGYLGLIPGGEIFTRYWRAKGFFQDPNVFAPYLILPAMYLLQRMLLDKRIRPTAWAGALFMILLIGVFASFSRAAWGSLAAGAIMVFFAVFFLEANAREKVRMLILSISGVLVIVVAIGGMLSIPSVQKLFDIRATDQAYDEGETGRFGRQGYAFEMALAHPLGLGPQEFPHYLVREQPHDSYASLPQQYGWGGALMCYLLIGMTVWRGLRGLTRRSPNRLLLIPLMATFVPLVIEAGIIDLDHWRHFFLVAGLIWGVTASKGEGAAPVPAVRHAGLI